MSPQMHITTRSGSASARPEVLAAFGCTREGVDYFGHGKRIVNRLR